MGVVITVCGAEKESDEYQAALKLKSIIQNSLPNNVIGEIVLVASATLYGQDVKDIDLMMLGKLQNYKPNISFKVNDKDKNGNIVSMHTEKANVDIMNFCTTIEVKRHDISGVTLQGTDFYVKYKSKRHCVTLQSNKQKIAVMNFLKNQINFSPYVTNVIWFTQIVRDDVDALLTRNGNKMISNIIGADFDFNELMQLLVWQRLPFLKRGEYHLECGFEDCSVDKLQDVFNLFSRTKEEMGKLTRKRIEILTNKAFANNLLIDTQGKISIYRGRAGTGKTVGLIQSAIHLVDEMQARVLILTYNKALVSDIRRLFALAELPDMFEENCVYVNTLHSYFFRLSNRVLYDGKMSGAKFIDNYKLILKELDEFMVDEEAISIVKEIARADYQLDWDYVLIDEAQDWTNIERDIVLKIFDKGKIIVADGGLQFVRNVDVCDWSVVRERNNIKLKFCLRQKENIIQFLNIYSQRLEMNGAKILSGNKMPGGKVIITTNDKIYDIHQEEMSRLLAVGNIAYDMLYLVPHSLVQKKNGESQFILKKEFENKSIYIWDGTNSNNRDSYSISADEVRVLQYDSARGLEGWTVVCMDFDVFLQEKMEEYVDSAGDALLLESPEERKKKFIFNWAMIPLTRAIDTLIIVLKDISSDEARLFKQISDECCDFVMWI